MNREDRETIDKLFRACRFHIGPEAWEKLLKVFASTQVPEDLPGVLERHAAGLGLPDYLPELARLEWAVHEAGSSKCCKQGARGPAYRKSQSLPAPVFLEAFARSSWRP